MDWVHSLMTALRVRPPDSKGFFSLTTGSQWFTAICIVYVIWRNVAVCLPQAAPPTFLANLGFLTGLKQQWTMFGPKSSRLDVWYVIPGKLSTGKTVDVSVWLNKGHESAPVSYKKPKKLHLIWRTHRMSIYFWMLARQIEDRSPLAKEHLKSVAKYLCRTWNRNKRKGTLESLSIDLMIERTPPPGTKPKIKKKNVFKWKCVLGNGMGVVTFTPQTKGGSSSPGKER